MQLIDSWMVGAGETAAAATAAAQCETPPSQTSSDFVLREIFDQHCEPGAGGLDVIKLDEFLQVCLSCAGCAVLIRAWIVGRCTGWR